MKRIQPIRSYAEYEANEERIRQRAEEAISYYDACNRPRHHWHNDLRLVIWRKMQDSLLMGGLLLLVLAAILLGMIVTP